MSLFQWPGRTSKVAFRDRVVVAFQAKLPQATIKSIGELEIQIIYLGSNESLSVWLGRAYDEFCENPEQADEIIARHIRGALATVDSVTVEKDRIIPTIKSSDWVTSQLRNGDDASRFDPWLESTMPTSS